MGTFWELGNNCDFSRPRRLDACIMHIVYSMATRQPEGDALATALSIRSEV